jgi:hypothetical protein
VQGLYTACTRRVHGLYKARTWRVHLVYKGGLRFRGKPSNCCTRLRLGVLLCGRYRRIPLGKVLQAVDIAFHTNGTNESVLDYHWDSLCLDHLGPYLEGICRRTAAGKGAGICGPDVGRGGSKSLGVGLARAIVSALAYIFGRSRDGANGQWPRADQGVKTGNAPGRTSQWLRRPRRARHGRRDG